jgi:6-phosphogluconolactonase
MENVRSLCFQLLVVLLLAGPCLAPLACAAQKSSGKQPGKQQNQYLVYVGTYTKTSKGIYAWRLNAASGELEALGLAAEATNPSFLAVDPTRRFLYAVSEVASFAGRKSGAVSAFAIDRRSGRLALLNQAATRGAGPCFVTVDTRGRNVLVANYGGGSVAVLPIDSNGLLGETKDFVQHTGSSVNPQRQQGPHAHSINLSPDNRFAIVPDLGLDHVMVYRFNPAYSTLAANEPPFAAVRPGAGPRHFAFHPSGRFGYVINELQSTVTAFEWDGNAGTLKEVQTISSLPADFSGESSGAEVQVHPSGKFLYASNRGHDSIAVFQIDESKGTLAPIEYVPTQGKTPRNFGIDPTGTFLLAANQNSDNITVFRIDAKTGRLQPTGQKLEVGSPVCVKFVSLE